MFWTKESCWIKTLLCCNTPFLHFALMPIKQQIQVKVSMDIFIELIFFVHLGIDLDSDWKDKDQRKMLKAWKMSNIIGYSMLHIYINMHPKSLSISKLQYCSPTIYYSKMNTSPKLLVIKDFKMMLDFTSALMVLRVFYMYFNQDLKFAVSWYPKNKVILRTQDMSQYKIKLLFKLWYFDFISKSSSDRMILQ